MAKAIEIKPEGHKNQIPDKSMKMQLDAEEMEKFYEAFPGIKEIKDRTLEGWEIPTIKVEIIVEAFKKKADGNKEEN